MQLWIVLLILSASALARADGTFSVDPDFGRCSGCVVSDFSQRLLASPPGFAMAPNGVLYAPTRRNGFVFVPGVGVVIGGAMAPDFGGMRAPSLQNGPVVFGVNVNVPAVGSAERRQSPAGVRAPGCRAPID